MTFSYFSLSVQKNKSSQCWFDVHRDKIKTKQNKKKPNKNKTCVTVQILMELTVCTQLIKQTKECNNVVR